jgi:KaiC/GvpD/RAD55 family RecA-like ATPase
LVEELFVSQESVLNRIKTGIPGLDELLGGGFLKKSVILVSGPPGGGKSIFCFQFLYQGITEGKKALFLTLDKKADGLVFQAKKLGLDFSSALEKKLVKFLFLNINKKLVYESMTNEILSGDYERIVLDSISPLSELPFYVRKSEASADSISIINSEDTQNVTNLPLRRLHLRYIFDALETAQSTSVITSELPMGSTQFSRDGISEFLADGVILLNFDQTMDRRKLSILKMRNTKHTLKPQDINIGMGGIQLI